MYKLFGFSRTAAGDQTQLFVPDNQRQHDVVNFRGLLSRLAHNPKISENYQVFGVYLGWRGLLVPGGTDQLSQALYFFPHDTSFWSRKNTAS